MKRRSLRELDTVIEEILERNPEFEIELKKIIEESLNDSLHCRSRSRRDQIHSTMEAVSSNTDENIRS
jgi:hypothetical protein